MKELDIKFASALNLELLRSFEKECILIESIPYHPNVVRYLYHEHDQENGKLRIYMTKYSCTLRNIINLKVKNLNNKDQKVKGEYFYFIFFYFTYLILFYLFFILFYLFYFIYFLFYFIILFYFILFYFILFYIIFILFSLGAKPVHEHKFSAQQIGLIFLQILRGLSWIHQ